MGKQQRLSASDQVAFDWAGRGRPEHAFVPANALPNSFCAVCGGGKDGIQHPADPSLNTNEEFLVQRLLPGILSQNVLPLWDTYDTADTQEQAEIKLGELKPTFDSSVRWRIVRSVVHFYLVSEDLA